MKIMNHKATNDTYSDIYSRQQNIEGNKLESALERHDKYLTQLEKQKKLLKMVQVKDKAREDEEKREQGFSPYVNGANAVPQLKSKSTYQTHANCKWKERCPGIKSALMSPRKRMHGAEARINTAPEQQRKFWGQGSIEIASENGKKLFASLGAMDVYYSDDFEDSIDFESDKFSSVTEVNTFVKRPSTVDQPQRKFWGQRSVHIKSATGDRLRASISNMKEVNYSMDFESDQDSSSDQEIIEKIESVDECDKDFTVLTFNDKIDSTNILQRPKLYSRLKTMQDNN